MRSAPLAVVPMLALLALLPAQANDFRIQTVMPGRLLAAEGNTGANAPFRGANRRIQLAYGRSMLDLRGPVRIAGLALRPDTAMPSLGNASYTFTLELSTCTRAPDALSHTFDNNHGADRTQVFSGTATTTPTLLGAPPRPFELKFLFSEPFTWDPCRGPLLFDFQVTAVTAPGFIADGASDGSESYGQVFNTTSAAATTANQPTSGVLHRVPVLDLLLDTSAVPDIPLVGGGTPHIYPWSAPLSDTSRTQFFYDEPAVPFAGMQRITHLAWRPEPGVAYVDRIYNVQVALSTGAANLSQSPSAFFENNHGLDRTAVFDGLFRPPSIAAGFPPGFEASMALSKEFSFDPSQGSLVVDIRMHSQSGQPSATFDGVQNSTTSNLFRLDSLATAGLVGNTALVLGIATVPSPVMPVPTHSGPNGLAGLPWNAPNGARVMTAFDQAALGAGDTQIIKHLSWQVRRVPSPSYGPAAFDATIDLSTGIAPASQLVPTFDSNHGPDRVRAFDGVVTGRYREGNVAYSDFSIGVRLDTPFRWDPTQGPLIVDVRTPNGLIAGVAGRDMEGRVEPAAHGIFSGNPNAINAGSVTGVTTLMRLNGPMCRGTVEPYGSGCGSALYTADNDPAIGTIDFACHLRSAPANHLAPCVIGLSPASTSLAPFGAVGCFLLTSGDLGALWFLTDASGEAVFPIPIPNAPAFIGFTFFQQWLVFDQATPAGIQATGGLKITIGS